MRGYGFFFLGRIAQRAVKEHVAYKNTREKQELTRLTFPTVKEVDLFYALDDGYKMVQMIKWGFLEHSKYFTCIWLPGQFQ